MTSLSDTLTVGLVLVLLFGSIALYLYTRIQQAEQKISLLETILLELKMSAEIKSYTELPASEVTGVHHNSTVYTGGQYVTFDEVERTFENDDEDLGPGVIDGTTKPASPVPSISSKHEEEEAADVEQYKSAIAEAVKEDNSVPAASKVTVNYESMTLKELQGLAKSRGIMGVTTMKKGPVIEALKTSDRVQSSNVEPGSNGTGSGSFLETSSVFLATESN